MGRAPQAGRRAGQRVREALGNGDRGRLEALDRPRHNAVRPACARLVRAGALRVRVGLAGVSRRGVTEMKIYLLGRRMFMYCETRDGFDPAKDFARAGDDPTYQKWDDLMRTMQEQVAEGKPGEWWAMMQLVFDLGWPQHKPAAVR